MNETVILPETIRPGGRDPSVDGRGDAGFCTVEVASSLGPEDHRVWRALRRSNGDLDSPFFCAEFFEEVARVRPGVRFAVVKDKGRPVAFWPHQLVKPGIAGPVGDKISCLQGVVCQGDFTFDAREIASRCGLRRWHFDHLLPSQGIFETHSWELIDAPYIDLRNGFDAYCKDRRRRGHSNKAIRNALAAGRRLGRDHGELRFDFDCRDPETLETMIRWKRNQMQATGIGDLFARSKWLAPFLANTLRRNEDRFRGLLSVLAVGEKPVAIQFGLIADGVLHGLFISYDREFARYSPGKILLIEMARQASSNGIHRIDLGKGDQSYKRTLMTDCRAVAVGAVDLRPLPSLVHSQLYRIKRRIARSPFSEFAIRARNGMQSLGDSFSGK